LETAEKLLIDGLAKLGIKPSDSVISIFEKYLHELKKWSRAYNLTALKKDEDIVTKHFLDSLLYLSVIPEGRWSICDIGSGAGFPGLPIAIVRHELNITLIEPSWKKAAFLKHMKRTLSIANVEVLQSRAEDIKEKTFDIAVTRALFSISDLIKKAGHLVKKHGFFILNKGPKFEEEIKKIPSAVKYEIVKISLPGTSLSRNIIKAFHS
jgi:16S rRNA (guanine527-N7)-methyltransferase